MVESLANTGGSQFESGRLDDNYHIPEMMGREGDANIPGFAPTKTVRNALRDVIKTLNRGGRIVDHGRLDA